MIQLVELTMLQQRQFVWTVDKVMLRAALVLTGGSASLDQNNSLNNTPIATQVTHNGRRLFGVIPGFHTCNALPGAWLSTHRRQK